MPHLRVLFVPLLGAALTLGACGDDALPPHLNGALLAKGVDPGGRVPIEPTSSFSTSDQVHCLTTLCSAQPGTVVRAEWRGLAVAGAEAEQVIDSVDITPDAGGPVDFTLTPSASLPPGQYRVDLFVNPGAGGDDEPAQSLRFAIVSTGPRIADAWISTTETDAGRATAVASSTDPVYCHVVVGEPVAGTEVTAVWIAEATGGAVGENQEIVRSSLALEGGTTWCASRSSPRRRCRPASIASSCCSRASRRRRTRCASTSRPELAPARDPENARGLEARQSWTS